MNDVADEVRATTDGARTASTKSKPAFSMGAIAAPVIAVACLGVSFVLTGSGVTAGFATVHASDAIENQFNLAAMPFLLPGCIALALLGLALWMVLPRLGSLWVRLVAGIVLAASAAAFVSALLGLLMGSPGSDIPWMLGLFFQPMAFVGLLYWLPAVIAAVWSALKPRTLASTLSATLLSFSIGLLIFSTVWYVIGGRTS